MTNYNQVLTQVYSLSLPEKIKLLEELKGLVNESLEVDDDNNSCNGEKSLLMGNNN